MLASLYLLKKKKVTQQWACGKQPPKILYPRVGCCWLEIGGGKFRTESCGSSFGV